MYTLRRWSVRHSDKLERFYQWFEGILCRLHKVFLLVGYERLNRPVAALERVSKGFLFDCQMCGECVLSSTGMSCPMNCPKNLRNGPCGGVRANGNCEVQPDMPCVWVAAWTGSRQMSGGDKIKLVQKPVDHRLKDKSAWLRVVQMNNSRVQHPESQSQI